MSIMSGPGCELHEEDCNAKSQEGSQFGHVTVLPFPSNIHELRGMRLPMKAATHHDGYSLFGVSPGRRWNETVFALRRWFYRDPNANGIMRSPPSSLRVGLTDCALCLSVRPGTNGVFRVC
jgi:hypothetical protein